MTDEIFRTIVESLGKKIVVSNDTIEGLYREISELYKENKKLREEIEALKTFNRKDLSVDIDLTTPEGYYTSLKTVHFKIGESNYYVYRDKSGRFQYWCVCDEDDELTGKKYISQKDASEFCEKFNN